VYLKDNEQIRTGGLPNHKEKVKVFWLLDGSEVYGVRTFISCVARRLVKKPNIELIVVAVSDGQYLEELRHLGCTVHYLGFPKKKALKDAQGRRSVGRILFEFFRLSRVLVTVAGLINKCRPDVIHTHTPHYHILGAILGTIFRLKVIWHWHGPYIFTGLPNLVLKSLCGTIHRSLCISQFVENTLPQCFQRASRVVYDGIELDENKASPHEKFRRKYSIPQDAPLIGTFGSVIPRKGFRYFIEAVPKILEEQPSSYFALVGGLTAEDSEWEWEQLNNLVEELGIDDRIICPGMIPDASKYMADFDVIVIPTIPYGNDPGEGFGLVVIESMAACVPPVVTSCGAFPEIIEDGISGLLVPPKSAEGIAEAVVKLLEDNTTRKKMGLAARSRVESFFRLERVVDEIHKIYLES
jgi:glycosyltransferase involved in cell wall biosynthesis